jgi:hypothetical protein
MRYALCLPRLPRRSPFKYRDRPEDRTGADFTGARDKEFRFFNIQYSLFTRTKRPALLSIFNFQFSIYNSDAFVNIQFSIFNLQFQWLGRETKNFGFLIFNFQFSIFNPYALQSTINNHQSSIQWRPPLWFARTGYGSFSDRSPALFNSRSEECNAFNRGSDQEINKNLSVLCAFAVQHCFSIINLFALQSSFNSHQSSIPMAFAVQHCFSINNHQSSIQWRPPL